MLMKAFAAVVVSLGLAASVRASEPRVVDRGPHHRTWETTRQVQTATGERRTETGSYIELQGGLHRWTEQGWVETRPRIEVFQDGAVATELQYQAIFAPNLATPGAIDLLLPDGQRLRGHLLGLAYTEGNQSVLIAEVKDCAGVIGGAEQNEVTFSDAFTDFNISVQFVLQRDRISQNVIVHQQLPHPSEWGLTEEAVLEVLTEFTTVPAVRVENREAVDGISSQHVSFESMEFVSGRAFSIGNEANATAVSKSWEIFEGQRSFVVEKIPWKAIASELAKLPPVATDWKRKEGPLMARKQLRLPRREQARAAVKPIQVAQATQRKPGYLIDWELVSSVNWLRWSNSVTYYIAGSISVKTNIFEGGTVIKYAPGSTAKIIISGPVTCLSSNYTPIILTARDDHSVGEPIGSASLSGMYADTALFLDNVSSGQIFNLSDLRISHADTAIKFNFGNGHKLRNLQIVNCNYAVSSFQSSFQVLNALFSRIHMNAVHPAHASGTIGTLQNVTIRECNTLVPMYGTANVINSLFIAVTNIVGSGGSFSGAFNGTNSNPVNVFQPVGAGYSYLTNNSPFRNAGTTNIDSTLLSSLRQLTTYPPIVAGHVTTLGNTNLTLTLQALRDTNAPDLGYHYAPLDYAFGGVYVTNSTITVQTGTAVGFYSPTNAGFGYGIQLGSGARFFSDGSPTNLNKLVRYNMVQEQSTSAWNTTAHDHIVTESAEPAVNPEFRFTFTEWAIPAADVNHFYGHNGTDFVVPFSHCLFIGGKFGTERPTVSVTNCLFQRVATMINGIDFEMNPTFQNAHFYGGSVALRPYQGGTWKVHDTLFHGTAITQEGTVTHNYNGYITNTFTNSAVTEWLTNSGSANVWTNTFDYDTGALGRFYQPTTSRFLDKGSTSANHLGLYHFTTLTNNVKETNSLVDIGFHYVATANGMPVDSDGDGIPDFVEDTDGDGVTDNGESSYMNPVLIVASSMDYIKGSPAKLLDTNAIAFDADTPNFSGGQLKVSIASGADSNDRLAIRDQGQGAGQIGLTNTSTVTYGGTSMGTYSGGEGTNALVVSLNSGASSAAVQALVRNLTFQNVSNAITTSSRLLQFTLTDGDGGTNTPAFETVNVICPQAIDAMLVIDISESLSSTNFTKAKQAATNFVSYLDLMGKDRVGLISFAGDAWLNIPLTNNATAVRSAIMSLSQTDNTRFAPPLNLARTNLSQAATNILPLLLLFSDGRSGGPGDFFMNRVEATNACLAVKGGGIRIISIAYGTVGNTNGGTNLMRFFASSPGDYYYSPSAADFQSNYNAIAQGLCRGLPPVITLVTPTNNQTFLAPADIALSAIASDPDGVVTNVSFYNGATKLADITGPPYMFTWTNVLATNSSFSLYAVAKDNVGLSATSGVSVTVQKRPPEITILSPPPSTELASVATFEIRTDAKDKDGRVTKVEFFNGAASIGVVTNLPFHLVWSNVTAGTYALKAVATDNDNLSTNAQVSLLVTGCPGLITNTLALNPTSVVGSLRSTGTVSIATNAGPGGVAVNIWSDQPEVSVPGSVLIPQGTNNTKFVIETKSSDQDFTAVISAQTSGGTSTANLSVVGNGFKSTVFPEQCGPMDVAVLLDLSDSMQQELAAIKAQLINILDSIEFASGGDYRLALVTFANTNVVHENFAPTNRLAFSNSFSGLQFVTGGIESSAEAIDIVVNNLTSAGRTNQVGSFTNAFRANAQKIIILITDELPYALDYPNSLDTNAHWRAVEAYLKDIKICAVLPSQTTALDGPYHYREDLTAVMQDYAQTTGGMLVFCSPPDPENNFQQIQDIDIRLQSVFSQCGADSGKMVHFRDDLRVLNYPALTLKHTLASATSTDAAPFDLSGLSGNVFSAQMERGGELRINEGSRFDLQLGVKSALTTNLASFGPIVTNATSISVGAPYAVAWELPFSFYPDLQQQLGSVYSLYLSDRASGACGNNYEVVDSPNAGFPFNKNVLSLSVVARHEIPQGRCRDLVVTGITAPVRHQWEIYRGGILEASSFSPQGWSVEPDHSSHGGLNLCVPANATIARDYELRYSSGASSQSGFFSVVPGVLYDTAPVLKPLVLSAPRCSSNSVVTITISLDAPARGDGAFVTLHCPAVTNGAFPTYVHIAPGEKTANYSFRPRGTSGEDVIYEITASYNGTRKASVVVVDEMGGPPTATPELSATEEPGVIKLAWTPIPNALHYRLDRGPSPSILTLFADKLTGTNYYDTQIEPDITYCYQVTAVNQYGGSIPDVECITYTLDQIVLRPLIIPNGGKFHDYAEFTISNLTAGAQAYFTTNGANPGTDDFATNFFRLTHSASVNARALIGSSTSLVSRADFIVLPSPEISCGATNNSSLANTNWPSTQRGEAYYAQRFTFTGKRGTRQTIRMESADFDTHLYLIDPSRNVVADSPGFGGIGSAIEHRALTNGTYIVECTTRDPLRTGSFTLSLDCQPTPELDVLIDAASVTNGFAFDFGITAAGGNLQKIITLTNSGSSNLVFSSLSVTSPFSVNPATLTNLATNSSTNLTITFNSITATNHTGLLRFDSNTGDPSEKPFLLNLLARSNPAGAAPTNTLTAPTNNQSITAPTTFTVAAIAGAIGTATVSKVEFYVTGPSGTSLIGSDSLSPYQASWNIAAGGKYTVKSVATDTGKRVSTQSVATVTINDRPVAGTFRTAVTHDSTEVWIDALAHAFDANNDLLTITNVSAASHGTAIIAGGKIYYTPTFDFTGFDSFAYTVTDHRGGFATGSVHVAIIPSVLDEDYPQGDITSPTNQTRVTAPLAVLGTANSLYLQLWQVQYRRLSAVATAWQTFAEGEANVTNNAVLGTFDPTGLPNGAYQIQLRVTDWVDGTTLETDPVMVQVGELSGTGEGIKVGQFTVAFNDLSIPVSGLPITLTRSYDSRKIGGRDAAPSASDFGPGWDLAVSSVRLEKSGVLGEGWAASQSLSADCIFNGLGHVVTITFPDNTAYRFTPRLKLNYRESNCTGPGGLSGAFAAMVFDPVTPGSGTLVALHTPENLHLNITLGLGDITLHENRGDVTEPFGAIYDPAEFLFTTLDGRQLLFNAAGKVVKMTDRNGNSLTFGDDGIIHSSGKSVLFKRDTAGRITRIYDPNGLDANGETNGPAAILYEYEGLNLARVRRLTDRSAPIYLTTEFLYTNAAYPHYLTAIKDPRGITGIRNEYDEDGKLKSHTDADGKTITYIHDINGRKETIVDRLGHTNIFSYDVRGNITNSINALGETNLFTYDANGNKLSETNPKGETIAYRYDGSNLLLSISNAVSTVSFGYNEFGQPTNSVDALGRVSKSQYNAFGNLTKLVDALTNATHFLYDTNGNLVSQKDAGNNIVTNRYDAFGRLTNTVELSTALTNSYAYDANGNRTNQITIRTLLGGNLEKTTNAFIYDGQDRLVHTIEADGKINSVVYDETGQQKQTINKLGRVTTYEYDDRGDLRRMIHPDQSADQSAYDAEGHRTFATNRLGHVTRYIYDALGRLTQTTFPDNSTSKTIYDSAGRVAHMVDARGVTNAFGYDNAGRRTSVTNAWGIAALQQITTYAYDAAGNLTNMVDAANRPTEYFYDDLNRRTNVVYADGSRELTRYDALGRKIAETDRATNTTWFAYDGAGRLTHVTNALGHITSYTYDEPGNLLTQTDARTNSTKFVYDSFGRRLKRTMPGGEFETFGYDPAGNVIAHTNFNGLALTNSYDSLNRLTGTYLATNGQSLITFKYSALGQRTNMTDASGTYVYTFDERGRLKTNATPQGTLRYTYDANGNLLTLRSTTINGVNLAYAYDALNRVTNVVDARLTGMSANNSRYGYDAVGNLKLMAYPNGLTNLYQYDSLNRLTDLTWEVSSNARADFAYRLGSSGNRTNLIETVDNVGRRFNWAYDNLYRLTGETISSNSPTGTLTYNYDHVGNRTNRSGTIGILTATNYAYGSNDWITTDFYDKHGNTTTNSETATFRYDYANRLTNYVWGTTNVTIAYNGDGQRVQKTFNGATTIYLVDVANLTGFAQVMEEFTVSGGTTNLAKTYSYGLDLISQRQISPALVTFYGYDGLGSVRFLTDTNGAITDTYLYDAFGTLLTSTGNTTNDYLFTSEQFDRHLRSYFLRARYLNPNSGRFWTMDSYEGNQSDPLSLHKYLYGHANPVNGVDPSGHEFNLGGLTSVSGIQLRIAGQVSVRAYAAYDRVQWLRDGAQILSKLLITGSVDPVAVGLFASDFIPFSKAFRHLRVIGNKAVGASGKLQDAFNLLTKGVGRNNEISRQIGELGAALAARAHRMRPTSFVPSYHGVDDIYEHGGKLVIIEAKGGTADLTKSQMSRNWIANQIEKLKSSKNPIDQEWGRKLQDAANQGKLQGMVVKTKIDGNNLVADPEFELKDFDAIGLNSF
jgi:RHS repeat-associated protein